MEPNGRLLGGRYELTGLIATGGMGQVWQGRDNVLARDVAVKVLRSEFTGDPTFLARFRAEAQLAARLVHPNIATLFDYGEVPPQRPTDEHLAYLVMELVRGESLSGLLRREPRLSPERTLDVLRQSAAGLAAAHAVGVVHRDVKPGNVLLGPDGTVKITDFGVALSATSVALTQTGQVIGTAHYLSPEQAQGARATPASDVYALGLVGYECLAGHRAFEAESSVQIALMQIREDPAPLPGDVPPAVRQLIESATVKDPARRFPDGAAFRTAIDDVLAGRGPRPAADAPRTAVLPAVTAVTAAASAPPPSTRVMPAVTAAGRTPAPEPAADRPKRRRTVLLGLLALLVVAGLVFAGVQLLGPADGDGTATEESTEQSTTPATPSSSPATTSEEAAPSSADTVQVDAGDYVGRDVGAVEADLRALDLAVALSPVETADRPEGAVLSVDPEGSVEPSTTITVRYAVPPPAPSTSAAPTSAPASTSAGEDEDEPDENEPDENEGGGPGNGNSGGNGNGNGGGNGGGNGNGG